ncbi:unnamed protein product [Rotaria socialis]|uniref:VCBS repeat-containing protein n=1 Tax=Rotaria socialis TaxID=392032 RepID=A0A821J3A3_9BILA|nr:unnamed protein product [Rotaria socialis]
MFDTIEECFCDFSSMIRCHPFNFPCTSRTTPRKLKSQCNATFGVPVTYSTSSTPRAIVAADVNADGNVDIIVANNGGNNVGVFINAGTGTFSIQMTYSTGASSAPNSLTTA